MGNLTGNLNMEGGTDEIIKFLDNQMKEKDAGAPGGYLIGGDGAGKQNAGGRFGKSYERLRNGSVGSYDNGDNKSVYQKINCDQSMLTKRDSSFHKNYRSVANIFTVGNH
jgi:hypothetical protein